MFKSMKIRILFSLFLTLIAVPLLFAQSATVTWTTTYQTIDGFGGSCAFNVCNSMTAGQAQLMFDPANGIGLSLFRVWVPDDGSCSTNCSFTDTVPTNFAKSYGLTMWGTPWSPPASMKSNSSTICNTGNTGPDGPNTSSLNVGSYAAFATYLHNFSTQFNASFGTPLYAISIQNEPLYCPDFYAGAIWTGAQIDSFIKNNLGPAMSGSGVKIMMPEPPWWNNFTNASSSIADTCMTDGACSTFVDIVAGHDYTAQNAQYAAPNIVPYPHLGSAHLWETETATFGAFDPSITDALSWAQNIHTYLTVADVNAWHWWWLMSSGTTNEPLIGSGGVVAKRTYAIGNWSKFVRPGWVRIGSTASPQSGVYVSAFKNPATSDFAIVAINHNSTPVNVDFSLSGFPSVTSVTPALTSSSVNLVDQAAATVSGGAFSYSLPVTSIVTFRGTASSSSSKNPAPPTNLNVIIH